jgi:hypothetical protein
VIGERRVKIVAIIAGTLAIIATAAFPATAAPSRQVQFDYAKFNEALNRFEAAHPEDYLGRERVLKAWGATDYRVTLPGLGLQNATASSAQAAIDRYRASMHASAPNPNVLSVSGSTALLRTGEYLVQGDWNFSDKFVGMAAPTDIAALEYSSKCWRGARAYFSIADYQGTGHNSLGNWYSADPSNFRHALAIRDGVSGFVSYNDNGNIRYFMQNTGCFTKDIRASFQYEHNQRGSVIGVSVGWGVLSVSYNKPDIQWQKSTGIFS